MTRTGAHFVFVNSAKVIKNGVVERDEQRIVTDFFSLNDRHESAQTVFLNGIIAPLSYSINDFELKIKELQQQNPNTNIFELLSKMNLPKIEIGKKIEFVLIENIDWEKKRITEQIVFRAL